MYALSPKNGGSGRTGPTASMTAMGWRKLAMSSFNKPAVPSLRSAPPLPGVFSASVGPTEAERQARVLGRILGRVQAQPSPASPRASSQERQRGEVWRWPVATLGQ